ncbi:hypothetical protein LINPERHAP1_LOCUS6901 [Linum perenne]
MQVEEEDTTEVRESIEGQKGHTTDQPKRKRATRRRIDVPEDSDSSGFVDDDNEVSDEETIDIGGFHVEGFTIGTEVMDDADSDYGLSDELNSTCSSDEESGEQGRQKRRDFNKNKDIDDPTFMVGQVFEDFATFKTAVKNHSIITKRPISFSKSDPTRVQVGCKNQTCRWYIYVSKSNDNRRVEIKSCYLVHDGCIMNFKNRFADYKYVQRFLIDPYWGIDSIIQTVHEDLHLQIGRDKAGRVRKHDVELARGKSSEQYARLYDYCAEVRKSNAGSTIFVEATEAGHFKRMYCCLGACKEGFLASCRRIICIDGCFLKTEVGGQLLTAVGLDANDGVYPIAYAAVNTENEDNWKWFLLYLTNDLGIDEESSGDWMIMSDKQKVSTVSSLFSY